MRKRLVENIWPQSSRNLAMREFTLRHPAIHHHVEIAVTVKRGPACR